MSAATASGDPSTENSSAVEPERIDIGRDHWALLITSPDAISPIADAWDELARDAATHNVFYERWMLEAAWNVFGELTHLIACYRRGRTKADPPTLIGLFPTKISDVKGSWWMKSAAELWSHPYGFLRTPLVRRGCCVEAIDLWSRVIAQIAPEAKVAVWERVYADGPVFTALNDWFNVSGIIPIVTQRFARAILQPIEQSEESCEAYLNHAISDKQARELRRQRRRLDELGEVTIHRPTSSEEADAFTNAFLELENEGWKGTNETAIAFDETHAAYYRALISDAWERGQLDASELRLDGRPIAVKLNLVSAATSRGATGFACKIAYDESLAKYSPGVLLELETIRHWHRPEMPLMIDSCAKANHPMIDRLWSERQPIRHLVFAMPHAGRLARWRLAGLALRLRLKRTHVARGELVLKSNY